MHKLANLQLITRMSHQGEVVAAPASLSSTAKVFFVTSSSSPSSSSQNPDVHQLKYRGRPIYGYRLIGNKTQILTRMPRRMSVPAPPAPHPIPPKTRRSGASKRDWKKKELAKQLGDLAALVVKLQDDNTTLIHRFGEALGREMTAAVALADTMDTLRALAAEHKSHKAFLQAEISSLLARMPSQRSAARSLIPADAILVAPLIPSPSLKLSAQASSFLPVVIPPMSTSPSRQDAAIAAHLARYKSSNTHPAPSTFTPLGRKQYSSRNNLTSPG